MSATAGRGAGQDPKRELAPGGARRSQHRMHGATGARPGAQGAQDRGAQAPGGGASARHVASRLLSVARPALPPLLASGAGRLLGQTSTVAILAVGGWSLGRQLDGHPQRWPLVALVLVLLALARGLLSYLEHYFGHLTAFRVLHLVRDAVFDALVPQAPLRARTRRSGDLLLVATKDVDRLEVFFAHALVPLAAAVVLPVAFSLAAAAVLPGLGLVLVAGEFCCLLLPVLTSRAAGRWGDEVASARSDLAVTSTDTVQCARDVLGYQQGPARLEALAEPQQRMTRAVLARGRLDAARQLASTALPLLVTVACAAIALPAARDGRITWAAALAVLAAVVPAHTPVTSVEGAVSEAAVSWGSARRVVAVLDAPAPLPEPAHPAPAPTGAPELVFDGVSLAHDDGPLVVRDVSLVVPPGAMVALVGPTGSGKSTLASAAARLLDPVAGRVLLGGTDARELAADDLRRVVAMVPQRDHLFDGTVRDNLLLAEPDATEPDLEQVARLVGLLHDDGWDLPAGLDTVVGSRGTTVSGGQRQRIGLARGLLRTSTLGTGRATVLVLDESTSDLDAANQGLVTRAVEQHCRLGGSALVVAHRLESVAGADELVHLADGVVVERGSHDQLLAAEGAHAAAWASQAGGAAGRRGC